MSKCALQPKFDYHESNETFNALLKKNGKIYNSRLYLSWYITWCNIPEEHMLQLHCVEA
jgi:hypothetical protein